MGAAPDGGKRRKRPNVKLYDPPEAMILPRLPSSRGPGTLREKPGEATPRELCQGLRVVPCHVLGCDLCDLCCGVAVAAMTECHRYVVRGGYW